MITPKRTWTLVGVAVALFVFIFFFERHFQEEVTGPGPIMPGLSPAEIDVVQVIPANADEIRVERTNGTWQLVKPVDYPANKNAIEALLNVFAQIKPQARITAAELNENNNSDAEFGLNSPKVTVIIHQQDHRVQIQLGHNTLMGDQTFLRIVGADNVNIVTSDLLKVIPTHPDQWRDLRFFTWGDASFDRIVVTNGSRVIEMQMNPATQTWQMSRPMQARADSSRIDALLHQLESVRVAKFVDDTPDGDLGDYGLNPPKFSIAFANDTNNVALFQFGSNATNTIDGIYAKRLKRPGVVLVPSAPLLSWQANYNDFRERHLVSISRNEVDTVHISGLEEFTLSRVTNDTWRVSGPSDFVAETGLVHELFSILNDLTISEFVKDVVTETDLPSYGLAPPSRKFVLKSNAAGGPATNSVVAQIEFGKVEENKIFVRRTDESSVYAMTLSEFSRLPAEAWQFRDRQIWNFTTNDIVRLTVEEHGQKRELIREGPFKWTFAAGSQGVINDLAIEDVAAQLGQLTAATWVDHGTRNRVRLGFEDPAPSVTMEVRKGGETKTLKVEFGGVSPSEFPYAGTMIDGDYMIFEFPWKLYQELRLYLFPPADSKP